MPIYFQLNKTALPISLESIGNHWHQVSVKRPHGYPFYHWLQTENGKGEIKIAGKCIILNQGEGILIAPFIPHEYYPIENWMTNFATFNGELKDDFGKIVASTPYHLKNNSEDFSFSKCIDDLILKHEVGELSELELSQQCYNLLLHLRKENQLPTEHLNSNQKKYIVPAIKEIETNYATIQSVAEISKKIFISTQYLNRLFQRSLGKSLNQYLLDFRISKAKELLINHPELEIQEISYRVGFQSTSHFIATFKSKTGYTPNGFRKLY